MTQVLVAGSGVAAVECVLALRALAGPRVAIELLSPVAEFVHRLRVRGAEDQCLAVEEL